MKKRTALILGLAVGGAAIAALTKVMTVNKKFFKNAALDGMLEAQLGQLAQWNGRSEDVRAFGKRMINDHGKANDELREVSANINEPFPSKLKLKQRALKEKLQNLHGAEFDRVYMENMTLEHGKDVETFRKTVGKLKNPYLKAWAEKTLPVLEHHLAMAKNIAPAVGVNAGKAEMRGKHKALASVGR